MASQEEIREVRLKKIKDLENNGGKPFPIKTERNFCFADVLKKFKTFGKKKIILAGRVMAIRGQGAIAFIGVNDGSAEFQFALKKDEISAEQFDLFRNIVDVGDFIEAKGTLFTTKTKQKTLLIKEWKMLSKSLRQLPDKWHGLQDVEERFRRRYLDILMSPEVKDRFVTRSGIIKELRQALDKEGFLEVETPVLQDLAGGANAEPFKTHHNSLDVDLSLRIAPELFLKKLIIAGYPKVYEIGRMFRNEGIDVTHNPEFTMLEFYEAYKSAEEGMVFIEKLVQMIVKKICGGKMVEFDGEKIDFSKKIKIMSFYSLLEQYAHINNPDTAKREDLEIKAKQVGVDVSPSDSKEKIIDNIYKKVVRPKLIQPVFVKDYPIRYLPLAKRREDNKEFADAFQLIVGGLEIVKAYSELNDPIDQKERFKVEEENKKVGDKEAQSSDEDFIEALEYGMPPTFGVGIGIDRLTMLLTNSRNIREVIFFPTLRPKK